MSDSKTGRINTISEVVEGESSSGKAYKKLEFTICNNEGYEGKEKEFIFKLFGAEKVDNFIKYNSIGQLVEVSYNANCRKWTNPKTNVTTWFTDLDAWKVFKAEQTQETVAEPQEDDLPF